MIHTLKSHPTYFQAMLDGQKRFEWRRDDRGFTAGDLLHLREWDPATSAYTGREIKVLVAYIMRYSPETALIGLPEGYCVMSIRAMPAP